MWIRMGCGLGWDVDWDGLLWVGMWIRMGLGEGRWDGDDNFKQFFRPGLL